MTDHRPSALELDLKRIVRNHPETVIHPHSPSGPYVRAVMWNAFTDGQIDDRTLGQAFWCTDTNRWVVRAADLAAGEESVVVEHPADRSGIAPAMSRVIARVRTAAHDRSLTGLPPTLATVIRDLRHGR